MKLKKYKAENRDSNEKGERWNMLIVKLKKYIYELLLKISIYRNTHIFGERERKKERNSNPLQFQ